MNGIMDVTNLAVLYSYFFNSIYFYFQNYMSIFNFSYILYNIGQAFGFFFNSGFFFLKIIVASIYGTYVLLKCHLIWCLELLLFLSRCWCFYLSCQFPKHSSLWSLYPYKSLCFYRNHFLDSALCIKKK